ncbi:MAG: hypothetical protein ACSHX0_11645 [Akkermansiaceae bacterium]
MKIIASSIIIYFIFITASFALDDDLVSITNSEGKTVSVYLKSLKEDQISFKIPHKSKVYTLKLDTLDPATQEMIKKWKANGGGASEKFKITYNSGKSDRLSKREQYDDRILILNPEVILKNEDLTLDTAKVTMTTLVFGRPVLFRSALYVFTKEVHEIKPIAGGEEKEITLQSISAEYDDDDTAQYGNKYLGYAVILHRGKDIIEKKMIPSSLDKYGTDLLALEAKKQYDKELREIKR